MTKKLYLVTFALFLILIGSLLLAGCVSSISVSGELNVDQSFKGTQTVNASVPDEVFEYVGGKNGLESIIEENMPEDSGMEYSSAQDESSTTYIFTISFDSLEDYQRKITNILASGEGDFNTPEFKINAESLLSNEAVFTDGGILPGDLLSWLIAPLNQLGLEDPIDRDFFSDSRSDVAIDGHVLSDEGDGWFRGYFRTEFPLEKIVITNEVRNETSLLSKGQLIVLEPSQAEVQEEQDLSYGELPAVMYSPEAVLEVLNKRIPEGSLTTVKLEGQDGKVIYDFDFGKGSPSEIADRTNELFGLGGSIRYVDLVGGVRDSLFFSHTILSDSILFGSSELPAPTLGVEYQTKFPLGTRIGSEGLTSTQFALGTIVKPVVTINSEHPDIDVYAEGLTPKPMFYIAVTVGLIAVVVAVVHTNKKNRNKGVNNVVEHQLEESVISVVPEKDLAGEMLQNCGSCGAGNKSDAQFCVDCGARLSGSAE